MAKLWSLRGAMLQRESSMHAALEQVMPAHQSSARNLVPYLSLRAVDLRELQEQLARLGLYCLDYLRRALSAGIVFEMSGGDAYQIQWRLIRCMLGTSASGGHGNR